MRSLSNSLKAIVRGMGTFRDVRVKNVLFYGMYGQIK